MGSRYVRLAVLSPAPTRTGWVRRASASTSSCSVRESYVHTIVAGDDASARFTNDSYLNHSTTSAPDLPAQIAAATIRTQGAPRSNRSFTYVRYPPEAPRRVRYHSAES